MTTYRDTLLATANAALAGQVADIVVRRSGSLALLNAGKELMWTGYSPAAELLKGLIVRVDGKGRAVDLVAACFPKFYNWTERPENDRAFMAAMAKPGASLTFTAKADGSNLRGYVVPETGKVEFATRGMLRSEPGQTGYGDFSGTARKIAAAKYPALMDPALARRYTVICEMISPVSKVITDYKGREDLIVLAVVDLATGVELTYAQMLAFCRQYRLTPIERYEVRASSFTDAVTELRRRIHGTDLEGFVAAVEVPGAAVPFRLKIKGETYLKMLAAIRRCTLKGTVELLATLPAPTFEHLRKALKTATPDLPEEVLAVYRTHFGRWQAWEARNQEITREILTAFMALPQRDAVNQKDFALSIAQDPRRNYFFTIRKEGLEKGPQRVLEMVRRARADEMSDETPLVDEAA